MRCCGVTSTLAVFIQCFFTSVILKLSIFRTTIVYKSSWSFTVEIQISTRSLLATGKGLSYFYGNSEWVKSLSCVWLYSPMDCGPPGSSIHGIFQAGVLDWVALFFSRGSPRPKAMEPYYLSSFICAIVKTDLLQFCRPPCWSGRYRSASLLEHSHTFTFWSLPFQVDSRVTSLKKPVLSLPLFPTVSCAYTYPAEMGWGLGPLLQHLCVDEHFPEQQNANCKGLKRIVTCAVGTRHGQDTKRLKKLNRHFMIITTCRSKSRVSGTRAGSCACLLHSAPPDGQADHLSPPAQPLDTPLRSSLVRN